jgi:hypothetical protein
MEVKTGESLICAKPMCHDTDQISCNFHVTKEREGMCVVLLLFSEMSGNEVGKM